MRTRLLALTSLIAAACRPPTAVAPDSPLVASDPAPPVVTLERPPTPEPEPPPTWAWAVSVLPALAGHSELDPGEAALASFLRWFAAGEPARIYLLSENTCHASDGAMDGEGYHGSWQQQVSVVGGERRVTGMNLDITVTGITQSGPGGVIYTRDRKGRWQEAGGFGTGWFGDVVDRPMTAADDRQVIFGGYVYRLEVVCEGTETVTQTCMDGGQRRCARCMGVALRPRAEHMHSAMGTFGVGRTDPTPEDCSRPCPADEWSPLLPRLAATLAGRQFFAALAGEGPVVFRSAGDCARERRRRAIAARRSPRPE